MDQSRLLIVAMAQQCQGLIEKSADAPSDLPQAIQPKHLRWMCMTIQQHAEDWSSIKLHRWIGFVQCGMLANRMLDLDGAKAMFNAAKKAYGATSDDQDLVDHLDTNSSYEMELGGQG